MDISIAGRHTLLFDDDTNAAFVNSSEALVPWSNDSSLLIDRYDVRHLLDRMPPRPKRTRIIEDTAGVPKSQLDHERFLDLPDDHDADDVAGDEHELVSESTQMSEAKGSGGYQAVPFSYGNSDISAVPNDSESGKNGSTFCPPFPVPDNLLSNLPSTEKQHQIISRTAKFVSEHGGQSEIVLRVKQGDNPTFGFLMPGNHLHAYFRYLVDHPHLLKAGNAQEDKKSDGQENEAVANGGGALSLLGSVYGFGDDDDNAAQTDSTKPIEPIASNTYDISASLDNSNKGDTCTNVVLEGKKESMKDRVTAAIMEKDKRNQSVNAAFLSKKVDSIISLQGIQCKGQSNQAEKADVKPLILEPPSFLKQTMDKIVEFILRNGKQFEAVLIEQDKAAGRFPFLLPSNQYNPYYVKLLQEAYESKLLGKNPPERSKRSREESPSDLSVTERSETSTDPNKKEKFKMVLGGPKKDSSDPPPKPTRVGVTADEAAAIVLAATRGRSPANFQSTSGDTGQSSLQHQKMPSDVSAATAIAKSVALAASNEAESSDALLTNEQKLKAERLKRAKMFAAMIKSGTKPTPEIVKSSSIPTTNVGSSVAEEREGSCAPVDAGPSHKDKKYRKSRHSRSKDHDEDSEERDDHKHSRRKKHVDDYDRHHRRHRHKHHNDSSEDEHRHEKRSRHRHRKHDDSSEDERDRSHKKRSKHRSRSERDREEDFGMSEIAMGSNSESAILDAKPIDNTEIPNDLRAKIRAMLMETL